jgi:hypothetical protein
VDDEKNIRADPETPEVRRRSELARVRGGKARLKGALNDAASVSAIDAPSIIGRDCEG